VGGRGAGHRGGVDPLPGAAPWNYGEVWSDLPEVVATLGFLFLGTAAPGCLDAADANDSGAVDLSDAVFTLGYHFLGTAAPPAPFGECGAEPTADELACAATPGDCL
jgi:hypothetical protein